MTIKILLTIACRTLDITEDYIFTFKLATKIDQT